MPGTDGLRLHDALIARGSHWPVIYMTGHGDVPLAVAAMRKGACSFLEKPFRESALEEALEEAFEAASARARLADRAALPTPPTGTATPGASLSPEASLRTAAAAARLTEREGQVLGLVIEGCLNKTIADRLGISIKTVELHRSNMMRKVGARSITELMRRVLTAPGGAP
jgi:two-component system response regulator FixJ